MIDSIIVACYLVVTLLIGLLASRNTKTINEFAVGKRNFPTTILLSTLFATVIGAGSTLGLSKSIYSEGLTYWVSHLGVAIGYFGLAMLIAPRFEPFLGLISSGDILGKMYGVKAKIFMGFATIFESVMLIAMQVLAITYIMQYFFNIDPSISALGSAFIIALYSMRGGIKAVTATDVFQFGILIIAIPLMSAIALSKINGFPELLSAIKTPPKPFAEPDHLKHLATFIFFCLPSIFPRAMQRMLMAKNVNQIQKIFVANSMLCVLFYVAVGIIGISAWHLLPNIEPRFVFPGLINEVMPIGLKGFVIAGLLAVFMSSIDSDLHLASVAIAHDIATPLAKNQLSEKAKLNIARFSTIFISILAASAALYFNSFMKIIYFLLCLSNAAFFPGYLLGFLGFKPSPKGFWVGLCAAMTTVILLTSVFDLFTLYTGLIAVSLNIIILLSFYLKETAVTRAEKEFPKIPEGLMAARPQIVIDRPQYTIIFAIFSLVGFMASFFFLPTNKNIGMVAHVFLNTIGACFSFLLIFRESWSQKMHKFFKPMLFTTMTICLSGISFLMCLKSGFDSIWILDLFICSALLLIFTNAKKAFRLGIAGISGATLIHLLTDRELYQTEAFAFWSLALHIAMLVGCLFLFRQQDAQRYKVIGGKLAHEAARSMSSMATSAELLRMSMPMLINGYEWAYQHGYKDTAINKEVLVEIKDIPLRLQDMGTRTAKTVNWLLGKMTFSNIPTNDNTLIDIFTCVQNAISDPSISNNQRNKINIVYNQSFSILGDQSQISQVILNIIENALHALDEKPDGKIQIWADGSSLYVHDNGYGISDKDLPNIFDEFFSTKQTMGQGLAFCKHVMSDHDGDIVCESKQGDFTQFKLIFSSRNG